jgi:formate C-acetyltransferase
VTNAEKLKMAQEQPEQYSNLAVRVSGFSQRFCLLDKKLQDHIIARTKHKTL